MTALYVTWAVGMLMTAGFGLVSTVWQAMAVAFVSESCITALVVIWFTPAAAGPRPSARPGLEPGLAHLDRRRAAQLRRGRPAAPAFGVDATLIAAGVIGAS